MATVRNFSYWSQSEPDFIVRSDGVSADVLGEFPLEPGEEAFLFNKGMIYLGSDGAGGGIFQEFGTGNDIYYVSDTTPIPNGGTIPQPVDEDLSGEDPIFQEYRLEPGPSINEGDDGTTDFEFIVTRSDPNGTSSVDVAIVPGSTDAADFGGTLPAPQTVTFEDGDYLKTVTFAVSGDTDLEGDESFSVRLQNPGFGEIDPQAATADATIKNDDEQTLPDPVVSFAPGGISLAEGTGVVTNFQFTVVRTGDLNRASSVGVEFHNGDTSSEDFVDGIPQTQRVNFAAGESQGTATIRVIGDNNIEGDETFSLSLINPTDATIDNANDTTTGTILDDDRPAPPPPEISIVPGSVTRDEGDDGMTEYRFAVIRAGDVTAEGSVDVTFDAGGTDADDFVGGLPPATQTVNFAAGSNVEFVSIPVSGDADIEDDETFSLALTNAVGATISATDNEATGTILNDDDVPPVISLATQEISENEGDLGTTEFTFFLTRSGDDISLPSAVQVVFDAGTTDAADFGGTLPDTQTVFFEPGSTFAALTIEVSGDTDVEGDETFGLSLGNAAGATISDTANSAIATIVNDDEESDPDAPALYVGTNASDVVIGTAGVDLILALGGADQILGNSGDDIIYGGRGNDLIRGGNGMDDIHGGGGNDTIEGGADNDVIDGGRGRDFINGGGGDDILTGGSRNDVFIFNDDFGDDVITDFNQNRDVLLFEGAASDDVTAATTSDGTVLTVDGADIVGTVTLAGVFDFDTDMLFV